MSEKQDKGRYFAFLVYEESAPSDWRETLQNSHMPFAISPLHEPDEEIKKPHWHVVYKHSNTITLDGAKRALPEGIAANNHVEMLHHPRIYQRYLIHLDDPDKQQFPEGREAIEVINGFPIDLTREFSQEERTKQRQQVFDFIREFSVLEYADLLDALMDAGNVDLLDYAANHTILFNTYLTSKRNSARENFECE